MLLLKSELLLVYEVMMIVFFSLYKILSWFSFFVRILSFLTFETQFIEGGNDDEDSTSFGKEEEGESDCHEETGGLEGHMDSFHLAEQVMQLLELSAWWFNMKLFLYLLF